MPQRFRLSLSVALLIGALAGCGTGNTVDTSVSKSLGFQLGNNSASVFRVGHRYAAGDVTGTTLAGATLSLSSLRGKVVVVNFWSSDCGPCRAEAQAFNAVARQDAAAGVAFLGIDERDDRAAAQAFEAAHHVRYPSIFDRDAQLTLRFPHAAPSSTPTTLVIDRSGGIAAKVNGALDYTHLRRLVGAIVAERV